MKNQVIYQQLKQTAKNEYEMAEKYYAMLSVVNNLSFTKRDVQLIAYTAINGNISYSTIREKFCTDYGTSLATINNLICKLKKKYVFVKDGDKVVVNPVINIDFKKSLKLEINLQHG
jgi:translation initiation factor IF-1